MKTSVIENYTHLTNIFTEVEFYINESLVYDSKFFKTKYDFVMLTDYNLFNAYSKDPLELVNNECVCLFNRRVNKYKIISLKVLVFNSEEETNEMLDDFYIECQKLKIDNLIENYVLVKKIT